MTNELTQALNVARQATLAAGAAICSYFHHTYEVQSKGYDNPVTTADLAADRILRARLTTAFPDDGWLSEETHDDKARLERQRVWVVDPLDGTKEFIKGIPEFAVSVALVVAGQAMLGIVHNPSTGELFHALRGGGAYLNDKPIRVTRRTDMPGSHIPASRSEFGRGEFDGLAVPLKIVPTGSIAYKLGLVAAGRADATWSQGSKHEWDVCAGVLLVEEAGGRVTDLSCQPHRFNQPHPQVNGIVASNGQLHMGIMALIQRNQLMTCLKSPNTPVGPQPNSGLWPILSDFSDRR
jgi:myo-inositol-1(or 4)-monophosphatase